MILQPNLFQFLTSAVILFLPVPIKIYKEKSKCFLFVCVRHLQRHFHDLRVYFCLLKWSNVFSESGTWRTIPVLPHVSVFVNSGHIRFTNLTHFSQNSFICKTSHLFTFCLYSVNVTESTWKCGMIVKRTSMSKSTAVSGVEKCSLRFTATTASKIYAWSNFNSICRRQQQPANSEKPKTDWYGPIKHTDGHVFQINFKHGMQPLIAKSIQHNIYSSSAAVHAPGKPALLSRRSPLPVPSLYPRMHRREQGDPSMQRAVRDRFVRLQGEHTNLWYHLASWAAVWQVRKSQLIHNNNNNNNNSDSWSVD